MLWLVIAALLVLQVSAQQGVPQGYKEQYAACKNVACRKKVVYDFNLDTRLRVRTLRTEENVRAELKLALALKKCEKLAGGEKDQCFFHCRLGEIHRKGSLLRRVLHEYSNAALVGCKKLKKKSDTKKCVKAVKHVHEKEIVRQRAQELDLISTYSVSDLIDEAKYAKLLPEASKCTSAKCQLDLGSKKCPLTEPGRAACMRVVLQAPINTGVNKYLSAVQEKLVKCNGDTKCMDEVVYSFRKETEKVLEDYARIRLDNNRKKFSKAFKACNGKADCVRKAQDKYAASWFKLHRRLVRVSFDVTMRNCDKLKKTNKKASKACRKQSIKSMKYAVKMAFKRSKHRAKALVKRWARKQKKDKKGKKGKKKGGKAVTTTTTATTTRTSNVPTTAVPSASTTAASGTTAVPAAVVSFVEHLNKRDSDGAGAWRLEHSAQQLQFDVSCADLSEFVAKAERLLGRLGKAARRCSSPVCYDAYTERISTVSDLLDKRRSKCGNVDNN